MELKPDTRISCLGDYLKVIEKLKESYPISHFYGNPAQTHFLYRGISDQRYLLLPSVFRIQEDILQADVDSPQSVIENDMYLTYGSEKQILCSFIREASNYLSLRSDQWLQWAEYAQHYGTPTRFLDWSSNPLVALYFACRDKKETDGKVWLLHHSNYMRLAKSKFPQNLQNRTIQDIASDIINGLIQTTPENPQSGYPILYTPYYIDTRMSAQSSWFMLWIEEKTPLETMIEKAKYQMDDIIENQPVKLCVVKKEPSLWHRFLIEAHQKQSILRELDTVGINEKTLFPGLDGIGRYVEKKYHFDYAEATNHYL